MKIKTPRTPIERMLLKTITLMKMKKASTGKGPAMIMIRTTKILMIQMNNQNQQTTS
jgi:hypothetical protein